MTLKNSMTNKVGWMASAMAIIMFSSYIDQIRLNLKGKPGSIILPIATIMNCIFWLLYATFRDKKDWPLISCNLVGIIISIITLITAII